MAANLVDVAFLSLGCKVNQVEKSAWQCQIERNGRYRVVDYRSSGSQPQVVVVNTCAVTATSAKKSQQLINRVRRENPAALILVMGCWGELIRQQRQFQPAVGDDCRLWYIGNYGKHRLAETLDKLLAGVPETDRPDRRRSVEYDELGYSQFPGRKSRAFVKIQDGCDSGCTYCIIPRLRGNSRSRSAEAILAEVGNAVARGYGEVVITGINIGQYYDHGRDWHLAELLNSICGLPGEFRVRLGALEVMEISEGLLSMF
ncbi:MAG: radical SAM protein, partial [Negativicutes bacterium]|nr:radical SAM protein [Negativicutes bacterium]